MPMQPPAEMTETPEQRARRMRMEAAKAIAGGPAPLVPTSNPSMTPTRAAPPPAAPTVRQGSYVAAPGQGPLQQRQQGGHGAAQAHTHFNPVTGAPLAAQQAGSGAAALLDPGALQRDPRAAANAFANRQGGSVAPVGAPPSNAQAPVALPSAPAPTLQTTIPTSGVQTAAQGDHRYDDLLDEMLYGKVRDTSAEEKMIQDQLAATVGQGQADLNARMGAAGFGTSGALGAMSGDMRRQATRSALESIMGIRQGARDDQFAHQQAGIRADAQNRGLYIQEDEYTRYLKAMQDLFPDGDPPHGGEGNTADDGNPFTFDPTNPYDPANPATGGYGDGPVKTITEDEARGKNLKPVPGYPGVMVDAQGNHFIIHSYGPGGGT